MRPMWSPIGDGNRGGGEPKQVCSLLREAQFAICSEPAAVGGPASTPGDHLGNIRGAVSVAVGRVVMRLNQEGFTQSDRLYRMRDTLAAGRPVDPDEIQWLNATIEVADKSAD
jgi:hypothetical protein